ncbi:MAG TPA: hypothetical protein VGM54_18905 [Chthoniobacter sp.]|jgi:hypothetical protein
MPDKDDFRVENPTEAFEKMRSAMKQILTVSKPEILKREKEAKEQRKRKKAA